MSFLTNCMVHTILPLVHLHMYFLTHLLVLVFPCLHGHALNECITNNELMNNHAIIDHFVSVDVIVICVTVGH